AARGQASRRPQPVFLQADLREGDGNELRQALEYVGVLPQLKVLLHGIHEAGIGLGDQVLRRLRLPVAASRLPTPHKDVVPGIAHARRARRRIHVADQFGVARGVGRLRNVYLFEQFLREETVLPALERVPPARLVPGSRSERALTLDENVVLGPDAVSAVREDRAEGAVAGFAAVIEDVAEHGIAAIAIVEIDRRVAVSHRAADVVPVVEADQIAPARGIAALVERAAVIGLCADAIDLVELEEVIVAADEDGLMRRVVNAVVGRAVPHALEREAVGSGKLMDGEVPDMVVERLMARRGERLAVSTCQNQSAR